MAKERVIDGVPKWECEEEISICRNQIRAWEDRISSAKADLVRLQSILAKFEAAEKKAKE